MDIALAVDRLRPGAQYTRCFTYEDLVISWEDETQCPTLEEIAFSWIEVVKEKMLAAVAAARYELETGGVMIAGSRISTDRESQALLTGACVRAQQQPEILINWKSPTGWVPMNKELIETISSVVANHVQACFNSEMAHQHAIAALVTLAEVEAYDVTAGWPE